MGGAAAVAMQRPLDAALEHALVGGRPAQAGARHLRDRFLRDRSLGGPHARGRPPEHLGVPVDRAADLVRRVLRMAVAPRHVGAGVRLPVRVAVAEERQDRVVVGRGGELDPVLVGGAAIGGDDRGQQRPLALGEDALVVLRVVAALRDQRAQRGVALLPVEVEPGQLGQDLEVAHLRGAEARRPPRAGRPRRCADHAGPGARRTAGSGRSGSRDGP